MIGLRHNDISDKDGIGPDEIRWIRSGGAYIEAPPVKFEVHRTEA
jgi:hypothetical protein